MHVYLDSSAIVSFFTPDRYSEKISEFLLTNSPVVALSDFAAAEFASAIAQHVRTGILTKAEARDTFAEFDTWVSRNATIVDCAPEDIAFASRALRRLDLNLRAPDAIHIAIAIRLDATFVTFDAKQAASAKALGVGVASV